MEDLSRLCCFCGKMTNMDDYFALMTQCKRRRLFYKPDPVGGGRRDVDSQRSLEVLHLHGEQQGRVGHLVHLLFDELRLCSFLEVFGLGDLVHKAQDFTGFMSAHKSGFIKEKKQKRSELQAKLKSLNESLKLILSKGHIDDLTVGVRTPPLQPSHLTVLRSLPRPMNQHWTTLHRYRPDSRCGVCFWNTNGSE